LIAKTFSASVGERGVAPSCMTMGFLYTALEARDPIIGSLCRDVHAIPVFSSFCVSQCLS